MLALPGESFPVRNLNNLETDPCCQTDTPSLRRPPVAATTASSLGGLVRLRCQKAFSVLESLAQVCRRRYVLLMAAASLRSVQWRTLAAVSDDLRSHQMHLEVVRLRYLTASRLWPAMRTFEAS